MADLGATELISSSLINWLKRSRKSTVPRTPTDGTHILSYGRVYQATLVLMFGLATALLALMVIGFWGDPARQLIVGWLFGLLWLAMLVGIWDCFIVTIKVSDRGLEVLTPMRETRSVSWGEIASIQ